MSPVDSSVFIRWRTEAELCPYLPQSWHSRLLRGTGHVSRGLMIQPKYYSPHRGFHKEAAAPDGGPPGSDPATLARDWLDRHGFAHAVLNHHDGPVLSTWGDADYPILLARAYNDWLIERWLSHDRRFLGSILVATQDPAAAAAEIDRVGSHPQVVQVLLPSGTRQPYGTRHYYPIYEAAERNRLVVAIQTGTEGSGTSNPPTSAGWPTTFLEWYACQPQNLAAHVTSLVTEGVFVRYPRLRFVLLDGGAAWVAPFLWRLDKNFKGLRAEVPWLDELPSAYVLRHFRFGTRGLEQTENPEHLWRYLRDVRPERTLLYASGYPSWDMQDPAEVQVVQSAAPAVRERIIGENAREAYGLADGASG